MRAFTTGSLAIVAALALAAVYQCGYDRGCAAAGTPAEIPEFPPDPPEVKETPLFTPVPMPPGWKERYLGTTEPASGSGQPD